MCGPRACIRICAVYRERNGRCRADRLDWLSHGAELGKAAKTLATDRAFESLHSCRPRIVTSSEAQAPATAAAWTWPNLRPGARARAVVLTLVEAHPLVTGGRNGASRATLPHAQTANSSISGRFAAVASRSPLGGSRTEVNLVLLNRELVRPNFSAVPLETELGQGHQLRFLSYGVDLCLALPKA